MNAKPESVAADIKRMLASGATIRSIAAETSSSVNTVLRYRRELLWESRFAAHFGKPVPR